IEHGFAILSQFVSTHLPSGVFNALLCQGVIPGISGVLVFIPQIAILFIMLSFLEESGYLARAVFLMDRLVRPFGLNGRSVVPLLSSLACAIPGVLATRGIANRKERFITLFVAPLMSCSARIPVFTLLISLVIPAKRIGGIFQLQGLVLFGLYALGILSALAVAWVLNLLMKNEARSYYLMEIPTLKPPVLRNIYLTVLEKIKVFIVEAGGIIVAISVLLWILASYGPTATKEKAQKQVKQTEAYSRATPNEREQMENSVALENSYIGILGKTIEPVIEPLGYDWKIGIALITSFAAREVFVGSLSTIYAAQSDQEEHTKLMQRLKNEKKADGTPQFTLRAGVSLMVFYVYAMQCISTLAVVKKETQSWFWPIVQAIVFGLMAYLMAFLAFNVL
ncbi:MAG: nucleoside recognition domain-containing protein, partial [Flavobacteriales bacterium]